VVTYDTIIDFDNPELKLFPGMTAYVTIPVAMARDVLKVPNGALRYNPDMKADELRALLKANGIETGGRGRRQGVASGQAQTQGPQATTQGGEAGGPGRQGGPRMAGGPGQGGERGASGPGMGGRAFAGGEGGEQPGGGMRMREAPLDVAIVWTQLPDKTLKPVQVRTGITDHTYTEVKEVLKGKLKDGDELIIGSTAARTGPRPGMSPGGVGRPR
jgi:HlyD family secretion protein